MANLPILNSGKPDKPVTLEMRKKRREAIDLIQAHVGQYAGCTFRKRTNGAMRKMHFRYRVRAEAKSRDVYLVIDRETSISSGITLVEDVQLGLPRYINLDGLLYLRVGGATYHWSWQSIARSTPSFEGHKIGPVEQAIRFSHIY